MTRSRYIRGVPRAAPRTAYLFFLAILFSAAAQAASAVVLAANGTHTAKLNLDATVRDGYQRFYILDYDGAISRFQQVQSAHPRDPMAVVYLLNATLFKELNRLDLLDTTLYAHEKFLTSKHTVTEDKDARRHVEALADQAIQMATERLRKDPNDIEALYARGAARSLKATYLGLVNRAFVGGLHLALQARGDHERVLQLDPLFIDGEMVVGIHEYVIGTLPAPIKIMAGIFGASGSKAKGIALLRDCALRGNITSVESRTALSLFLRHDARYDEAIEVARSLSQEFPRDYLFRLEEANLLKDAGKGALGIAAYRSLLDDAKKAGTFQSAHLELAYFGLGEALRGQNEYSDAASAYLDAAVQPTTSADLKHRARLAAGEMFDLSNQRMRAVQQYQALLGDDAYAPQADAARRLLRSPYKGH